MKSMRILLSSAFLLLPALLFATAISASAYTHARRGPTAPNLFKKHSKGGIHTSGHPAGPREIDSERATQIQAALIKSGYLAGTPSGHWDAQSEAAMQKLQGDQGWQTKLTPDSRALILLGLGPDTGQAGASTSALSSLTSGSQKQESTFSPNAPLESTFVSQ
jgi:hypothetical protein